MNALSQQIQALENIWGCLSSLRTEKGRRLHPQEEDSDVITPRLNQFRLDLEPKLSMSQGVQRMAAKTQVMTNQFNLHIRTRITHSSEVIAGSSLAAEILGLNIELSKAIALGHDMGHPPFGHDGEDFLKETTHKPFCHEVMSVVIAQHIERKGKGLNLTHETLRGFIRHSRCNNACNGTKLSPEGELVAHEDRINYTVSDYEDLTERLHYPVPAELRKLMEDLGHDRCERFYVLTTALCIESAEVGAVSFSKSDTAQKFREIMEIMDPIYKILNASNTDDVLMRIFEFLSYHPSHVDPGLLLALMTDTDVLNLADCPVLDFSALQRTTVNEIIPSLENRIINYCDADLNW